MEQNSLLKQEYEKAVESFKYLEQFDTIKSLKNELVNKRKTLVKDEDKLNIVIEKASKLGVDKIKTMSLEELHELFVLEDGKVEFSIDFDSKEKEKKFIADYLIYLIETEESLKKIDEEMEKLEEEIKKHDDEIKKVVDQFGNISNMMRVYLQEEYDASEGEKKEKLGKIIKSFDNATSLENVYEIVKSLNVKNIIYDYTNTPNRIYERFINVIKKLKLKNDFTQFENLEQKFLPEKYHTYPNLFIFIIMKIYGHKKNDISREDGVFLSQLGVNFKHLFSNNFNDESKKEEFIGNIKKVLDVVYNNIK